MSCYQALKLYRMRGRRFESGRKLNRAPPHLAKFTPEIREYVMSKETLQKWSGLTLCQRVAQLLHDTGLSVTR